jgi:hypothetical protein
MHQLIVVMSCGALVRYHTVWLRVYHRRLPEVILNNLRNRTQSSDIKLHLIYVNYNAWNTL